MLSVNITGTFSCWPRVFICQVLLSCSLSVHIFLSAVTCLPNARHPILLPFSIVLFLKMLCGYSSEMRHLSQSTWFSLFSHAQAIVSLFSHQSQGRSIFQKSQTTITRTSKSLMCRAWDTPVSQPSSLHYKQSMAFSTLWSAFIRPIHKLPPMQSCDARQSFFGTIVFLEMARGEWWARSTSMTIISHILIHTTSRSVQRWIYLTSHDFGLIIRTIKYIPHPDPTIAAVSLSKRWRGWLNAFLKLLCQSKSIEEPRCNSLLSTAEAIVAIIRWKPSSPAPTWEGSWLFSELLSSDIHQFDIDEIAEKLDSQIHSAFCRITFPDWTTWVCGYQCHIIQELLNKLFAFRNSLVQLARDHREVYGKLLLLGKASIYPQAGVSCH